MKEQEFFKLKNKVEKLEHVVRALVSDLQQCVTVSVGNRMVLEKMSEYEEATKQIKEEMDRKEQEEVKKIITDAEEVKP